MGQIWGDFMREKSFNFKGKKTGVFLTVDSREREDKNTAGTVNGEGESQKTFYMVSILLSIGPKQKAGSI